MLRAYHCADTVSAIQ